MKHPIAMLASELTAPQMSSIDAMVLKSCLTLHLPGKEYKYHTNIKYAFDELRNCLAISSNRDNIIIQLTHPMVHHETDQREMFVTFFT